MTNTTPISFDSAQAPAGEPLHSAGADAEALPPQTQSAPKPAKKPSKPDRKEKRLTKALKVEALLARKSGVTLDQMGEATGWQAHTCRAFMSGLRKKGREVVRETGKAGKSIYRFAAASTGAKAG
ncbi:DUF3489 domain-containing protein [Erythrobacter aurantius]|uniref:DUF3489 domain-containing protein n=1 Tax=Erythrobacter aurantius TaxID=2909249 RepID=UPI00207A1449|nr:DUF3489 domain-containing protein [Erythrobacter aurantius]